MAMGLWKIDQGKPLRLNPRPMDFEKRVEDLVEADSELIGEKLLFIGRQVQTPFGGVIDLLGIDSDGVVYVIELKRDKTPREVVAQVLDYASWVATLDRESLLDLYRPTDGSSFEKDFARKFGTNMPEDINAEHKLMIVAAEVDAATQRMVGYLNAAYAVPINAILFHHFEDAGETYLAHAKLIDDTEAGALARTAQGTNRTRAAWNGHDWYVAFGEGDGSRSWEDARRFGFVSAGGGEWYSRSLRNLPTNARVFVYIPKQGYVGIGTVTHTAVPYDEAMVTVDGEEQPLRELELIGTYDHPWDSSADSREYVVAVDWEAAVPTTDAVREVGLFANQNSACRLRDQFTIDEVTRRLLSRAV